MQECGLSINLQQFKMKVIELTQTRVTPFWNGIHASGFGSSIDIQKLAYDKQKD
jgi:hypothetical protein